MALEKQHASFVVSENARGRARRTLRLQVPGSTPSGISDVLIYNLSETGLLIETVAALAVGEAIELELPEAGTRVATVVWNHEKLYGCVFLDAITVGDVSAALLRSPADPTTIPPQAKTQNTSSELSLQAKARTIVGLAFVSWALVGAAAYAFAS